MRTMTVIGDSEGAVIVEELDEFGTLNVSAKGRLTRAHAEELVAHLQDVLRETRDNLPTRSDDWFI